MTRLLSSTSTAMTRSIFRLATTLGILFLGCWDVDPCFQGRSPVKSLSEAFLLVPLIRHSKATQEASHSLWAAATIPTTEEQHVAPPSENQESAGTSTNRNHKDSNEPLPWKVKSVGVDYGLARTGVAVSDLLQPSPIDMIREVNRTKVCERIVHLCGLHQVHQVVVGFPLGKNGTEERQSKLTQGFVVELAILLLQRIGPKSRVYLWDERYTTKEAIARMYGDQVKSERYAAIDDQAACLILESFHQFKAKGSQIVKLPRYAIEWCETVRRKRKEEVQQQRQRDQEQRAIYQETVRQQQAEARELVSSMDDSEILGLSSSLLPKKKKKHRKRKKR